MILNVKNICGLRGTHQFNITKGCNILNAPNASGKSSLMKAIYLAFCAKYLEEEELNQYLTDRENIGFVEIKFDEYDDRDYFAANLIRDQKGVKLTSHTVPQILDLPTNKQLLMMNFHSELFNSLIYNHQKEINEWIINITKSNAYRYFLEYLSTTREELQSEHRILLKGQKDKKQDIEQELKSKEKELENLNSEKSSIENTKEYRDYVENNIKFNENKKDFDENIKKKKAEKQKLEDEKNEITRKYNHLKQLHDKKKKEFEDLKKKKEEYEAQYEIIHKTLSRDRQEKSEHSASLSRVSEEIKKNEKELEYKEHVKGFGSCPYCNNNIDKENHKKIIDEIKRKINFLNSQKTELIKEIKNLEENIRKNQAKLENLEDSNKKYPQVHNEYLNHDQELKKIEKELKKYEGPNDPIKKIDSELLELEKALQILLESNAKENPIIQKLLEVVSKISKTEAEIKNLKQEIEKMNLDKEKIEKLEKKIARAKKLENHYEEVLNNLTTGFIDKLNKKIKDSFELLKLAELKRIDISPSNFKITIEREDGSPTDIDRLSGAELAVVFLIIFYTIQKIVIPEAPVLLIDEITSEIDDTRFKTLLNYIANELDYILVARHTGFKGNKEILKPENIVQLK